MADGKPRCKAILSSGGRCSAGAEGGQDWCWNHSPDRAEERRKNAAAGGLACSRQAPSGIGRLKNQIEMVTAAVLKGGLDASTNTLDHATAAVALQGLNTTLRAIEVERKLDHQRDLEDQVALLRSHLDELKGRRRG